MAALIRCILHLDIRDMDEDEVLYSWGQIKYYLKTVKQVEFN